MKTVVLVILSILSICNAEPKMEPGPCPDYPAMETFDLSKGRDRWTTFTVYASKVKGEPECRCSSVIHTKIPNTNSTFLQFTGYFPDKPDELVKINATCSPIDGKPGVFNVKHEEKYEFLGNLSDTAEFKFYILDTDYDNYSVGLCCYGDGRNSHSTSAVVDHRDRIPAANLLEKAKKALERVGWDLSTIDAVDQTNCTSTDQLSL